MMRQSNRNSLVNQKKAAVFQYETKIGYKEDKNSVEVEKKDKGIKLKPRVFPDSQWKAGSLVYALYGGCN